MELERTNMGYLSDLVGGKPIVPCGPLLVDDNGRVMRWLDGQQPGSVARGLELSGEHFVWMVRFLDDEGHRALPRGSHWWWRGGRHSGASCHTGPAARS